MFVFNYLFKQNWEKTKVLNGEHYKLNLGAAVQSPIKLIMG